MSDNQSSQLLTITLPVEQRFYLGWEDFCKDVGGAVSDFFLKGPAESSSSGIKALLGLALSFKMEKSPGYLIWVLTITALAWSIDKTDGFEPEKRKRLAKIFRSLVRQAKSNISDNGVQIPVDFFQRPTRLDLYAYLRDPLIDELSNNSETKRQDYRFKIDSAFNLAIFDIYSSKTEYYQLLFQALEVPNSTTAALSHSWRLYRAKLIYEFEVRPLFGQEQERISLSQFYIPLRATWRNEVAHPQEFEGHEFAENIARLDIELDDWLEQDDPDDWLRLIGGGPGSGKSTTLKALARRAANNEAIRPLYIPLQNIGLERELREAVNHYFTEGTDSSFTTPPLSRSAVEDGAPLLLIFDGLDELAAPGEAAREVVSSFASKLIALVAALSGDNRRKIKIVVSGRMPAFQAAEKFLPTKPGSALETFGFLPSPYHDDSDDSLWTEDQRGSWWRQYATVKGEDLSVPEAFSSERLSGITNEPLLCYLLALAGFAHKEWELAADNRNRIYHSLIESVYDRGWGDGAAKRLGPGKTLSKSDFIALMETIALAAWLGGDTRVASEKMFLDAIPITNSREAWDSFTADNGQDVANLAMNFYLKSDQKTSRGFEFTHKSFGEYLAARALLSIAEDAAIQTERRLDHAMQDWIKATRTGRPTIELLSFLRDEMRLRVARGGEGVEKAKTVKSSFEAIAHKASLDGFPLLPTSEDWRSLEVEQGSAECCTWMVLHSCANALFNYVDSESSEIRIKWHSEGHLSSIIERVVRLPGGPVLLNCLSFVDATKQTITGIRAEGINFQHANLSKVTFVGSTLCGNFNFANMSECRFYMSRVYDSSFIQARMTDVVFHVSVLMNASFDEVQSAEIKFSPMTFMSLNNVEFASGYKPKVMVSNTSDVSTALNSFELRKQEISEIVVETDPTLVGDFESTYRY